ncbi:sporulation protein [Alkalihalobacillus sp. AL-G]|uniref:sporulation protein n=1 Tax=Alkalihalobacillus sp. AL-G TaxID=2926399 RepID=UPI002729AC7D|nr:sporulation protein [Alkalihalobacillus sp. AL-G]WLD93221.1 sporulation protein [Alkalihalobacillus sp. AL-G]
MSFVNRMLASVGIGSAVVDTKLEGNTFYAGETIEGVVEIKGGKVDQHIDEINLYLMTQYVREVDDRKVTQSHTLDSFQVAQDITVSEGEQKKIPFKLPLPLDVPVTIGKTPVWLKTGLDIKQAVDPKDEDYITIKPTELSEKVLDAIEQLGFRLRKSSCVHVKRHLQNNRPFVQEFEFIPTSGPFNRDLDELEVVFFPEQDRVRLMIEVDKRGKGLFGLLEEALDVDEQKSMLTITRAEVSDTGSLQRTLENHIRRYV